MIKVARVLLLFAAFFVFLPGQVQALGIGVAPHRLELDAYPLGSSTSSLNVFNTSDERSQYRVYVEGEGEEWFSIAPEEFVLDPHSSREVKVVVSPPLSASGYYNPTISIVSLVPASELKVGVGVKIPVHIRITPPPPLAMIGLNLTGPPLLVVLGIAALLPVGVAASIFIWRRRKTRET